MNAISLVSFILVFAGERCAAEGTKITLGKYELFE